MRIIIAAILFFSAASYANAQDLHFDNTVDDMETYYTEVMEKHGQLTVCLGILTQAWAVAIQNDQKTTAAKFRSNINFFSRRAKELREELEWEEQLNTEAQSVLFDIGTISLFNEGIRLMRRAEAMTSFKQIQHCWAITGVEENLL